MFRSKKKQIINIATHGFQENERLIFRSMFLLTTERDFSYQLAERAEDASADIMLVNGDNRAALQKLDVNQKASLLFISTPAARTQNQAWLQKPPNTTRLLAALDKIVINQANHVTGKENHSFQNKENKKPRINLKIIGFGDEERLVMRSIFLLTTEREPSYLLVERKDDPPADVVIVNGDSADAIQQNKTISDPKYPKHSPRLYVGVQALENKHVPHTTRPINATRLLQALDGIIFEQRARQHNNPAKHAVR